MLALADSVRNGVPLLKPAFEALLVQLIGVRSFIGVTTEAASARHANFLAVVDERRAGL